MKRLHDLYSHASEIPRSTRALANDICAGCVHYDTFLERHLEGKVVLRTDMQAALAQTVEYIKCRSSAASAPIHLSLRKITSLRKGDTSRRTNS